MYKYKSMYLTEEQILSILKDDGLELKHIKRQTNKMCITALTSNITALPYVKKQNDLIYKTVLRLLSITHEDIVDKNNKLIKAIKKCPYVLMYVYKQNSKMVLTALKQHPNSVLYVNMVTDKIIDYCINNKLLTTIVSLRKHMDIEQLKKTDNYILKSNMGILWKI